jgi:hypothetical protein
MTAQVSLDSMKLFLASLTAAAIVVACLIGAGRNVYARSSQSGLGPQIQIVTPSSPYTVAAGGKVPLEVQVLHFKLEPRAVGRTPVKGHGHYHFYVDCIPSNAYTQAVLDRCWAAAAATPVATFDLKTSAVKVKRGVHLLLVALAQNNHVLVRAPAAAVVLIVK